MCVHVNQVSHLLPLLKRGIGVHHSGLLPILKEVIEILFQEGLLKVIGYTYPFGLHHLMERFGFSAWWFFSQQLATVTINVFSVHISVI